MGLRLKGDTHNQLALCQLDDGDLAVITDANSEHRGKLALRTKDTIELVGWGDRYSHRLDRVDLHCRLVDSNDVFIFVEN